MLTPPLLDTVVEGLGTRIRTDDIGTETRRGSALLGIKSYFLLRRANVWPYTCSN